jgi:hypothetical protein
MHFYSHFRYRRTAFTPVLEELWVFERGIPHLDIWTPPANAARRPVLVWLTAAPI